ncbi:MAG TPA: VOC family protein [Solirubrobacterales bacterium]|jgi:catechol-2,3-dioxygenase|nr:VOC family protein [Solirubrobacterales bacterium]
MEVAFDGVCELVLESRAPERMVDFYERLGLRILSRESDRVWLAAGPRCRIGIWPPGEKEHHDRGGSHVHFALSAVRGRLDAMIEQVRGHGWDFEGPISHAGGDRSIYLFDPEGNRLEVWDYFDDREEAPR